MSDWHCQVCIIEKMVKHPNADNLYIATVMGDYPVVTKTGQYNVGDKIGYIAIDSIVPDVEAYYFLCPKAYEQYEEDGEVKQRQTGPKFPVGSVPEKYRIIKAKRIRNVYSMGMLVDAPEGLNVGDSIVEALGLTKWEEEENDNIPRATKIKGGNAAKAPEGWSIPYYDIEGARKYFSCLNEGEEIYISEKCNGSSAAYCHDGEKLWQKSRNFYKKPDPDDPWVDIAIRYGLEEKLSKYPGLAFFGEMIGLQKGFRYDCEIIDSKLYTKIKFFDIYDTKAHRYLDYDDFVKITDELGLERCPELYRGPLVSKEHVYAYAEGKSILNDKHIREGIIIKPVKERYEPKLDSRMMIKLIGEGYSLQK